MKPQVRYAKSGDVNVAYAVLGDGPVDLVLVPGWVSNISAAFDRPNQARFFEGLAEFSRLVIFDKRGTGLSDRMVSPPTIEERMDDLRSVMDAVGLERASIFGVSEGGSLAMLFAATYPHRTNSLALFGAFAKRVWSPDYPWAPTPEEREVFYDEIRNGWDSGMDLEKIAPSLKKSPTQLSDFADYLRLSASPSAAMALARINTDIDVRHVLPSIRVPTLVMNRTHDVDAKLEEARWIAGQIPNARFVEMEGSDHVPFIGNSDAVIAELQEFLTGHRPAPAYERVLATVLFTDIVRSTATAASIGDSAWCELLRRHDDMISREVSLHRGRIVKSTGDGALAIFDGPARGTQCALRIVQAAEEMGIGVRAGLHSGEIELLDDDIGGLAVHIASRVAALAGRGEVLVTRTVKDLTSGSALKLVDRGKHDLAGVPERWRLYLAEVEARHT
jgi:pimeloyl-ACP methyl ester carboxylesterase